jgi:hypothetical protein
MKVFFWGLVIVALCYGAYSGMMAAWSWIAVNNAVDEIISKQGVETIPAAELKKKVLSASSEAGVTLDERAISITPVDHPGHRHEERAGPRHSARREANVVRALTAEPI